MKAKRLTDPRIIPWKDSSLLTEREVAEEILQGMRERHGLTAEQAEGVRWAAREIARKVRQKHAILDDDTMKLLVDSGDKEAWEKERALIRKEEALMDWIDKVEKGEVDEASCPGETVEVRTRLMAAARQLVVPVELMLEGVYMFDSYWCAKHLIDTMERILACLSLRVAARAGAEDRSESNRMLGRFYAEMAREVHEYDRLKGKPTRSTDSLAKMLQVDRGMREAYEEATEDHGREGWASRMAHLLERGCRSLNSEIKYGKRWRDNASSGPISRVEFIEEVGATLASAINPKAKATVSSPWHRLWMAGHWEFSVCMDEVANEKFLREWRELWTEDLFKVVADHHTPRFDDEFEPEWDRVYKHLWKTLPLSKGELRRVTSVKNALRASLKLVSYCDSE